VSVLPLSLAQLASMAENMERGGGGATQHNFTLADLISNVSEVRGQGCVGISSESARIVIFDFTDLNFPTSQR